MKDILGRNSLDYNRRTGLYFGLINDRHHFDGYPRLSDYMTYGSGSIDVSDLSSITIAQTNQQGLKSHNNQQTVTQHQKIINLNESNCDNKLQSNQEQLSFLVDNGISSMLPEFEISSVRENLKYDHTTPQSAFISPNCQTAIKLTQCLRQMHTKKNEQNNNNTHPLDGVQPPGEPQSNIRQQKMRTSILKSKTKYKLPYEDTEISDFVFVDKTHCQQAEEDLEIKDTKNYEKNIQGEQLTRHNIMPSLQDTLISVRQEFERLRDNQKGIKQGENTRKSVRFSEVRQTKNILTNSIAQEDMHYVDSNTNPQSNQQNMSFLIQQIQVPSEPMDNQHEGIQEGKRKYELVKHIPKINKKKQVDFETRQQKLPDQAQKQNSEQQKVVKHQNLKNRENKTKTISAEDRITIPKKNSRTTKAKLQRQAKSKEKQENQDQKGRQQVIQAPNNLKGTQNQIQDDEYKPGRKGKKNSKQSKLKKSLKGNPRKLIKAVQPEQKQEEKQQGKQSLFKQINSSADASIQWDEVTSNQSGASLRRRSKGYPKRNRLQKVPYWQKKVQYFGSKLVGVIEKRSILSLMNCKQGGSIFSNSIVKEDANSVQGLITLPAHSQISCIIRQQYNGCTVKGKYHYKNRKLLFDNGLAEYCMKQQQKAYPGEEFVIKNQSNKQVIIKVTLQKNDALGQSLE